MLVCQLNIYFEEMSVQILCLFFHCCCCCSVTKSCPTLCNHIGFLCFRLLSLRSLYILNANLIAYMCFSNTLGCGLSFHYLNGDICRSLLFISSNESNLSVLSYMDHASDVIFKKSSLNPRSASVSAMLFFRIFVVICFIVICFNFWIVITWVNFCESC